jgi:EmrB/QacA subfamily drug resistance transporter
LLAGKQCTVGVVANGTGTVRTVEVAPRISGERPPADPRRWIIFAIVGVALMMSSIDQTIVGTALPALQHDLHAQINWVGWTVTVYSLGRVLALPLAGRLSDQYSRRTVFVFAIVLFVVTSLGCGLVSNIYAMIALRAIQAFGGAAFMPSATGLVSDSFGPARDRAVGMFTSIVPIGGVIGPVLGGIFVTYWSWRGIFLVNVPIGAVLAVLALRYIPANKDAGAVPSRLDVAGMASLALAVLSGMIGISYLGEPHARLLSVGLLLPEAVAIAAMVVFLRHINRTATPFIPPRLLRGRGFGAMNLINFWYGAAALGFAALVPLYATQRYGVHTLASGVLLTARAIGITGSAALAAMALRRTGYRRPMMIGFLVTAVGLIGLALHPIGTSVYMWLAMASCLTGLGMGVATPASNNASLQLATDQVAAIAGLRGMFRQAGSITAVSVTTAILARSPHPGIAQAYIFAVFAAVLLATIPLITRVQEHRGGW